MYATQLITALTELVKTYGDLPVMDEYGHVVDVPEFNDDDGRCILVSFDEGDD